MPKSPHLLVWRCLATLFLTPIAWGADEIRALNSPDGRIQVSFAMPRQGSKGTPKWSASFRGKEVLKDCGLGLQAAQAGNLLEGARLLEDRRREADERIPVLFGKADHANDRYHEARFEFQCAAGRRLTVAFRCYDDAIAFRYEVPSSNRGDSITITDETTSFQVVGASTAWLQQLENYNTSHEHSVVPTETGKIPERQLFDLPLTFSWADGTYAALTEAALRHYAGMALMREEGEISAPRLVCKLTPKPDGTKVARSLPMQTPWRVVLLGDRPGALLESCAIFCLNEPRAIEDPSWIRPGKITFSWWNGDVYDGQPGGPILSLEMARKYIDFCARNQIAMHSMTSTEPPTTPWYRQSKRSVEPGPDTDVTQPREGFDLAAIRQYAEGKGVRLWTWVHQAALRGRVEEAFAAFERLGWSGMMVDFFDHDDQESIEFAESIIQAAARHHLLIQFHGIWKPTGWERTYPNLVNHEGALNLEYLKWSDRCPPEHSLRLAFTRLIAGPMDYHLGGFRAVPRSAFKPRNVSPNVMGTRCQMLAMYVCWDNPNPMLADYPAAYEGQPGFDFLKLVPTWWDETRVLVGEVGELLVTARRKGTKWYIGGMAANRARDLELPLGFLGSGEFNGRLWTDAPDAEENPNHLVTATAQYGAKDSLKVHLAKDGGFVAELTPTRGN